MGYIMKRDFPDITWVLSEHGEFPSRFSDSACRIVKNHYFAKGEESFFEVVDRVVTTICRYGYKTTGHFDTEGEAVAHARKLAGYMLRQQAAFNSPVYYNVGVNDDPQCSACFIQSVDDDMDSILDLAKKEGKLFKYGSGTGTNLSPLRGKGEPLSGGGEASGPVAFMHMYDAVASTIKSGGRTRRAAKMVLLDCTHPDVDDFVTCKMHEDRKAKQMIAGGMDPDDAYGSVKYQNGNNTVRLTDEFMGSLMATNSSALKILDTIAQAAWECGDPGVQFTDTINRALPAEQVCNASNPCGEFMFIDNSACNLASINMEKVSLSELEDASEALILAMDIIVDMAGYPSEEIRANSVKYRPLGLGLTGVGSALMLMGHEYGSAKACDVLAGWTHAMALGAVMQSGQLARKLGSPWGGANRNAQLTLMAPTGTTSFMMDAQSTGIEPVVAETTTKFLSDGTTMDITPRCVEWARKEHGDNVVKTALGAYKVTPQEHLEMMAAAQHHLSGAISKTINMPEDCTPEDIRRIIINAWTLGLKGLAIYRDGSKGIQPVKVRPEPTVDLDTAEVEVGRLMDAMFTGGPMVGSSGAPTASQLISVGGRVRLPDVRNSITHKFSVGGIEGYLTVGLYAEGYPGEIFLNISKEGSTIGGLCDAWATAFSMGLQYGVPLSKLVSKFKGSSFSPAGFTGAEEVRSASSIVDYIARWLEIRFLGGGDVGGNEDSPEELDGDEVVREGVPSNEFVSGNVCPECGGLTQTTGTCHACPHCGWNGGCG